MSADSTLKDVIDQQANRGFVAWMLSRQVFWIFLATLAAFLFMWVMRPDTFATPQNLFNVTRNFAFVGIIAIGMTAVIITGGIDLSVGGTMLIGAMVTAVFMNPTGPDLFGWDGGWPAWATFILAMAACILVGLINGLFIAVLGLQPFVVTLGMMAIARSMGLVISGNKLIFEFGPDQKILTDIGAGQLWGIPNEVYILVVIMLLTGFAFRWTRWGRHIFAIGGNEKAAILTGVPVKTVKVSVYVLAAFLAGLAGWLQLGWLGSAATSMGVGMELTVIAAAVIGGANLAGGTGTAFGAVIGAALIELIRNSLILLGISTFWQGTFVGTFIVLAVAFDRLRNKDTSE
jgi:ribose transport system permease protein